MESFAFNVSLAVTVMAIVALFWRFEARISGVEARIFDLSDHVSRIEGLLKGYILQASKRED